MIWNVLRWTLTGKGTPAQAASLSQTLDEGEELGQLQADETASGNSRYYTDLPPLDSPNPTTGTGDGSGTTVVVSNTGTGNLRINNLAISGANARAANVTRPRREGLMGISSG